ncbi:MAG TPA: hypothetical protein VLH85_03915 [Levilinea sp.]|nr:hypothetical protein [Levilinea sp.]
MVNLAAITIETVENSLKAARAGRTPHKDLLSIHWAGSLIPEENILVLEKTIHDMIWNGYADLRRVETFPPASPYTRQELLDQIREDFQVGNSPLLL